MYYETQTTKQKIVSSLIDFIAGAVSGVIIACLFFFSLISSTGGL